MPDFDPDIDDISPTTIDQESNNPVTQGSASSTPKNAEQQIEHVAPTPSHQYPDWQETDWPDATPVEIPSQSDQQNDQRINIQWTRCNSELVEIPQLKGNSEEEQYQDLDTYLMHHNAFEASQCICQDYRSRLLTLDNEKYYKEVDRAFYMYRMPAAQDYWLANQVPGPR